MLDPNKLAESFVKLGCERIGAMTVIVLFNPHEPDDYKQEICPGLLIVGKKYLEKARGYQFPLKDTDVRL
jgi:hypothetical protein